MTDLTLVIEHAPSPQAEVRRLYHGGQFVIGRGEDADWQLDDPEMFVSRKHCVISDEGGRLTATDASSGGLFVDGASTPLGAGNSVELEPDMRLRLGDFVIRIEMAAAPARPVSGNAPKVGAFSFEFGAPPPEEPKRERPKDLPTPFGLRTDGRPEEARRENRPPPRPFDDRDPFALDLKAERREPPPARPADTAPPETPPPRADEAPPRPVSAGKYFFDEPDEPPPVRTAQAPEPEPEPAPRAVERPATPPAFDAAPEPAAPVPPQAWTEPQPARAPGPSEADAYAAFLRGLGVDPRRFPADDPEAELEALGRRFRALTDGLVHLLRTRAQEKQKVRVAQTIVGSANVNPLKFAVATDDAVESLLVERGAGYLPPDAAIAEAYRDLADHQVRTWSAVQSALRRMIDRFDPEEFEREADEAGRLETLLAGGKRAMLWELYLERYADIAKAAEERFLGEVGGDFRDAYEGKGRERHDD